MDSTDRPLADLIAGQLEVRRLEMEEVAAGVVEAFESDDQQILIELTGLFAGATGLQPTRWEVEEAVDSSTTSAVAARPLRACERTSTLRGSSASPTAAAHFNFN